jgi:hypothetical protein
VELYLRFRQKNILIVIVKEWKGHINLWFRNNVHFVFKPTASFLQPYDVLIFNDSVDSNMDANDASSKSTLRWYKKQRQGRIALFFIELMSDAQFVWEVACICAGTAEFL